MKSFLQNNPQKFKDNYTRNFTFLLAKDLVVLFNTFPGMHGEIIFAK